MLGLTASLRELTNARALDTAIVDANGDQITSFSSVVTPPATATLTSVAAAAVTTSFLAANLARHQVFIFNDSTKTLKVAFAATASATAFTILLGAQAQWESDLHGYTGAISGIWASAAGFARITEVTT